MEGRRHSKGFGVAAGCGLWLAVQSAYAWPPAEDDVNHDGEITTREVDKVDDAATLPEVQVSATRSSHPRRSTPAAISVLERDDLRLDRRGVALSDVLSQVPGILARQRNNLAQDEQVSIRGFGARATFGIRGVRFYQDGIPATMPDGQGQVSNFNLEGADHIEVLRGPFSALYGNASGGVVQVFTGNGADDRGARATQRVGSDGFRRTSSTLGFAGAADVRFDLSRFDSDGYRDHSAAQRTLLNGKAELELGGGRELRLLVNGIDSPQAQDPLGLTAAQMRDDPRQVAPAALDFDTRKRVRQVQTGAVLVIPTPHMADSRLHATAWAGQRDVRQFLSVPVAAQANPLSGGGVVDLHSPYFGVDVNWEHHSAVHGDPFDLVVGIDSERQRQHRRGYENFLGDERGVPGALRRDESDNVAHDDFYMQVGWRPHPDWFLHGGFRHTRVRFSSDDDYVTAGNPDDSGSRRYSVINPVFGASWQMRPGVNFYVATGHSLETPTFDELGYRPDGSAGLNLQLRAARTRNGELGVKLERGAARADFTLFRSDTTDELAVATNSGGRSTYHNVGPARRQGVEAEMRLPLGARAQLALTYTYLRATYRDDFITCASAPCTTPTALVPSGTRIPGLPRHAFAARARWGDDVGWSLRAGAQVVDAVPVANVGDARAAGYATFDASIGYGFDLPRFAGRVFVSGENLGDRRYAGSVIVNEANGRYFEPASGRTVLAGVELQFKP